LAALPEQVRDAVLSANSHLETAISRRAFHAEWDALEAERDEVRAGWIALEYMMRRALPLGPLAQVPARYVSRSKVHHRDCYLLRSAVVETAPLGDIAHRPCCSICDGPGFSLSEDHLDYLWAVMAVDDVTDDLDGLLRRSWGFGEPDTLEAWQEQRQGETDACRQAIAIVAALASAEPRMVPPVLK
jgi:hypothetical protein